MFQRSKAAYERALSLDPNRVAAASNLIALRVERGELGTCLCGGNENGEAQSAHRRCTLRIELCTSLCGHAGKSYAGVQYGAVA